MLTVILKKKICYIIEDDLVLFTLSYSFQIPILETRLWFITTFLRLSCEKRLDGTLLTTLRHFKRQLCDLQSSLGVQGAGVHKFLFRKPRSSISHESYYCKSLRTTVQCVCRYLSEEPRKQRTVHTMSTRFPTFNKVTSAHGNPFAAVDRTLGYTPHDYNGVVDRNVHPEKSSQEHLFVWQQLSAFVHEKLCCRE